MKNRMKKSQPVLTLILGLLAVVCLLPLVLVIIVSFTDETSLSEKGFSFFPGAWSLKGWQYVAEYSGQILKSYQITLFEVIVGTCVTLLFTSMFAYALSRKDWVLNRFLSVVLLITMLFNGGMVSSYIVNTNMYHLKDNLLVLVLPGAVSAFNCIVMRTFIQSNIPDSLIEAAKIDGAGEFYLFFQVVLPLMIPSLAAIGFMSAIGHWNEWQQCMLYIDDPNKTTLQLLLVRIEKSLEYLRNNMDNLTPGQIERLNRAPGTSMRMALLCVTMGPILIVYPFFQRYFIQGITVGAVKG
ncbi:MAG: carbohydrate ABC transporter permease [Lachnospiraceae bacterium]|nr:carbohydrate ABC transporter permease [Lachnospiraceae bacterium]